MFNCIQYKDILIGQCIRSLLGWKMAAWLQRQINVPIYLHEKAIPEAKRKGKYQLYRHLTWGHRPAFDAQPITSTAFTLI